MPVKKAEIGRRYANLPDKDLLDLLVEEDLVYLAAEFETRLSAQQKVIQALVAERESLAEIQSNQAAILQQNQIAYDAIADQRDALVAALEKAIPILESAKSRVKIVGLNDALNQARAALRLAKGETT